MQPCLLRRTQCSCGFHRVPCMHEVCLVLFCVAFRPVGARCLLCSFGVVKGPRSEFRATATCHQELKHLFFCSAHGYCLAPTQGAGGNSQIPEVTLLRKALSRRVTPRTVSLGFFLSLRGGMLTLGYGIPSLTSGRRSRVDKNIADSSDLCFFFAV